MLENTARGTPVREFALSSAIAAEFFQPMNRYTASGKPSESPENPRCSSLGSNGLGLMWLPCGISSAIAITTSSTASNTKNTEATARM